MSTERQCGRIGRDSVERIAVRATDHVMTSRSQHAVCLSPDGHVTVESLRFAAPDDLVGVYARSVGMTELRDMITEDLRFAATERAITGGREYAGARGRREQVLGKAA